MAVNETPIWLPTPEVSNPPEPLPRNSGRSLPPHGLFQRLYKLLLAPGVWHKVAAGDPHRISPYAVQINGGRNLPGRWEAVTRQGVLYARFLGDD